MESLSESFDRLPVPQTDFEKFRKNFHTRTTRIYVPVWLIACEKKAALMEPLDSVPVSAEQPLVFC